MKYSSIKRHLHLNRYSILFSISSAIFLTITCYSVNNLPVLTGENLRQYLIVQKLCEQIGCKETIDYDSFCFFNVSNDKQLVYTINENDTIRTSAVTDRYKLLELLKLINESGEYKYVILDLHFLKEDTTQYDNDLFEYISNMKNIVYVVNDSNDYSTPTLDGKTACAQYYSTIIETNFTRYEYLSKNKRYLPLKVYEDIFPEKQFKRFGKGLFSVYFSEGKLCQKSIFLTFDTAPFKETAYLNSYVTANNDTIRKSVSKYLNMGYVLSNIDEQIPNLNRQSVINKQISPFIKNKYVVIGNLVEDIHSTYTEEYPGSLIIARALQSLVERKHIVSMSHTLCWFIVYFLIAMFLFKGLVLSNVIPLIKNTKYRIIPIAVDMLTFTSFMLVVEIIEYVICGSVYSIIVPTYYFIVVRLVFHYKKNLSI